ncbi:MAG: ferrous iron transport protein B [Nitrospirae bacterium]|nr:ferrous iron transport protein B [Nitrospirota bacterium]
MRGKNKLLVALAGQPNVGKSTVFNILTGLSQHVGNWPGKTVEKKEGFFISGDTEIKIVDLPGTYSLTAFSEEERVARDFVIKEQPGVIILITNAAALERSLYLLSELLLLGSPVVLGLNMIDVAQEQGIQIDVEALKNFLGIPVVPLVATKNKGLKELISGAVSLVKGELSYNLSLPRVSPDHKEVFDDLLEKVKEHIPQSYPVHWVVTKLMEGDPEVLDMLKKFLPAEKWEKVESLLLKHEDSQLAIVAGRYDWIEDAIRASVSQFKRGQILLTDRLDQVLTRPVFGIPILLGILGIVFVLTYGLGSPLQGLLEWLINSFARWIDPFLYSASAWIRGIIIDGIIGGAGTVLTFLPILLIFFAAMAFLEDVGYMARAAFVMDRFMHIIGLHGKSFLPIFLGFGCNVPAVLGARIIESERAKILTILLTPFVPCTARLAVLALVAAAVFGSSGAIVSWSLVALNILALGIAGMLVSRFFLKGQKMPFIMELPLYHRPNPKTICVVVWNRLKAFIKRAGTVILGFSVFIWIISNIPGATIEESLLGWMGLLIEPLGEPLGLDWKMIVALLGSFVAKENTIAMLGVLYGVGEEGLRNVLPNVMSHASALSFLVVMMLFIPCAATVAVMKQEIGSWKWFLFSFVLMFIVSFGSGLVAYRLALLLGI